MMAMNLPIIFSLSLIGLALGAMLIVKAKKHKDVGTAFPKFIGYVVVIFSLINLVCAGFCAFTFMKSEESVFNGIHSLMMQEKAALQSTKCPCTAKANQNKNGNEAMPMKAQMQQQHMGNSMMQNRMGENSMMKNSDDSQEKHMDDMPMNQESDTED